MSCSGERWVTRGEGGGGGSQREGARGGRGGGILRMDLKPFYPPEKVFLHMQHSPCFIMLVTASEILIVDPPRASRV